MSRFSTVASVLAIAISVASMALSCSAHAAVPAASDHQPPRFLPAVVLYDKEDRFIAIEVGKTFSYSCKAALDDAQGTIEKATAAGRRLVGLCVPVPTYNAADLVPTADAPKPDKDNTL